MKKLWQRRLHRCARALSWTTGVAVILLAVLAALTQLLLPLMARHPQWVAEQLSQRLQRPVAFASMQGRWTTSGPLFIMHGVTIGAAAGETGSELRIPESELKLDFGGWLLPSRHLLNLHARGLQLSLLHGADGVWHINGIGDASGVHQQPVSLGQLSLGLWLDDLQVVITDAKLGKNYTLLARQLRLSAQGDEIRFGGMLQRAGVAAALRTVGRFRKDGSAGQIWIGTDDVELGPLLDGIDPGGYKVERGHGKLAAWLDWRKGRLTSSLVRFDLDKLVVTAPGGAAANVSGLHGLAGLYCINEDYDVRWAGDDGSTLAFNLRQPGSPQASVNIAARDLQVEPLLPWLALKPALAPALAEWMGNGHPRGEVTSVVLHWSRADGLQGLDLTFRDLMIDPVGKLPGVGGLRGELRGDAEALSLELPAQATTLQFPHRFRQPFVLSKLAGTLVFWPQDGDWHIGADTLDFVGTGYAGQVRGEVILPAQGGAPFMDMYARLDHAEVPSAKLFWPLGSMSPGTIEWLDRALVAGSVDQAQVLLRGDLADWPFRHNEGRFEARAVISGLTLDYGEDWPRVEGASVVASFVDNGMLAEASGGQSLSVKADKAVAVIPDFADGLLDLSVQGSGSGAGLMEFVRKSPIGIHQADTLGKLKLGGSGTFDFHLVLPLKKVSDAQLDGTAQLKDADLAAPEWKLKLDKLNGPLQFDLHGMQAGPLTANFRGQPSSLTLTIAGANSDPGTVLSAQLRGNYRIAELVQDYPALHWLGELADGRSDFTIGFALAHAPGSDALAQTLSIDSSLSGIMLDLPAPLDKSAAASLPLHLSMSLPVSGSDLKIALGQVLRGRMRLPAGTQQALAATLAFGNQMPTGLPDRDLRIRGHADHLDVTGWVQRAVAGGGGGGPGLESVDISTDHAAVFGRPLGSMQIRATPQSGTLGINVEGVAMAGNFSVPLQELNKRGVTARLQRLYWPKEPAVGLAADATSPTASADPADTGINPAALPPMHLLVGDLRLGDAKLGESRLETWPTASGMHIEQLRSLSSRVQINGSGDWNGTASNSHTHMRIDFAAEDLGAMLSAFGYEGLVDDGKTHDQLDATWPGAPSAPSLANMDGTLSIHVTSGHIPAVTSPGVGRLLGLVSLSELPRRLTLDFGDVFGKGVAFDSIAGDFKLANGNATTSNLLIKAPAANISITGRTGLRARDYDQQVLVVPHVGNSLPLVGAVVGGPIGVAAGLAVQGLLGRGLNQASSARYTVTGSWDKPVMTLVEKRAAGSLPVAPLLYPAADGSAPAAATSVAPAISGSAGH